MIDERYSKNLGALTAEEIETLRRKRVCVLGCGGLGGYAIELLARLGIGSLTVVDGDSFAVSNLNRQLLSTAETLGKSKALAAAERVTLVNPDVKANAVSAFITKGNADSIIENHDLVIDALDSVFARKVAGDSCDRLGIPMVHGAISGWCAQIAVIPPNSGVLNKIYPSDSVKEAVSCLSFTPALASSVQIAEAAKVLLSKGNTLESRLLIVDLLTQEYNVIAI